MNGTPIETFSGIPVFHEGDVTLIWVDRKEKHLQPNSQRVQTHYRSHRACKPIQNSFGRAVTATVSLRTRVISARGLRNHLQQRPASVLIMSR